MKIVFAGTGDFALFSLQALVDFCQQSNDCELVAVYTQPDRKSGRGRHVDVNAVKQCAVFNDVPVYQPASLKKPAEQAVLAELKPTLMVVASYGLLLPSAVLNTPDRGCINVHASLLPRWRGASPIQQALLAKDAATGITIMQMDEGLDTGDSLYQTSIPIPAQATTKSLGAQLGALGASALITTLQTLDEKQAAKQPQPAEGVSYARKLTKQQGMIDWSLPAVVIERQVRAFNPWPISFTWLQNKKLRVWHADVQVSEHIVVPPGTMTQVNRDGIQVATGKDIIRLTHVQREGGRCLPVKELLNGPLAFLKAGMRFQEANELVI